MRKLLIASLAALSLAAAACSDSTAPAPSVAGTYALQSVNSTALPFTLVTEGAYKLEVLSDSYQLRDDGTYAGTTSMRETAGTDVSLTDEPSHGTWSRSGNSIVLTDSDDPTIKKTAALDGAKLTVSVDGYTLVYVKAST